jgi:hypothetical protein
MTRIIHLEARRPYRLFVRFDDGTEGEDDLAERMRGPVFEPLRDLEFFAKVRLSEWGAPVWPNGLDIAPDALYERIHSRSGGDAATASR